MDTLLLIVKIINGYRVMEAEPLSVDFLSVGRAHSESELRAILAGRGADEGAINMALAELPQAGFATLAFQTALSGDSQNCGSPPFSHMKHKN